MKIPMGFVLKKLPRKRHHVAKKSSSLTRIDKSVEEIEKE